VRPEKNNENVTKTIMERPNPSIEVVMNSTDKHQLEKSQVQKQTIALAATFTAEPVEDSLEFWMQELEIGFTIEFAPYHQVFQQLLAPLSLLAQNQKGINIVLLRFEDWLRFDDGAEAIAESTQKVERNVQDLVTALKSAVAQSASCYIVCLCPASPAARADANRMAFFQQMEDLMVTQLSNIANLYLLLTQDLNAYPVADYYDPQKDELGHIPFTTEFFTALGTALARKIYAIKSAPHKVIVLDCDNTLWKGVVGEDGVMGIEITSGFQALQELMVAQQQAGMLLCLCSKNNYSDVVEVFEQRPDMPLKREQIVSMRINWLPKSENIKALATELNLGLDSFIFIDDNPVECAEVQANCPEVLTLGLPISGDIRRFLDHVWAFDRLDVTDEDKQRTALYQQNVERSRFAKESLTIEDFLAGLALKVEIKEPSPSRLPRVSQLTNRTNQFNFTTIRRSEAEIQQLSQLGVSCRIVEVSDRFGDYGVVGVMIFSPGDDAINVDTFLLSCRVLGRGVEHRMLTHLAEIAIERGLSRVDVTYIPTQKNLPALHFLDSLGADFKQPLDKGYPSGSQSPTEGNPPAALSHRYYFPVEFAAAVSYKPQVAQPTLESDVAIKAAVATGVATPQTGKSALLNRIATELYSPEPIRQRIESQQRQQKKSRTKSLQQSFVAPRTETERVLADIWAKLLRTEVGIKDNYFELGGTSLRSVELFAQIQKVFNKKLPLTTLIEAPTIEQLANKINQSGTEIRESLVLLKDGSGKPPLFLVHDGDGETMLYLNLARRLKPEHPVYGIQPYSQEGYSILHTRIAQMAAYYIEKIRTVQPSGPYLLGGMCAGGVLAFEIARQLQIQGQKVALVALIDAADVQAPQRIARVASQRLSRFSKALQLNQQLRPSRLVYSLNKVKEKVINLITYETRTKIQNIQHKVKMMLFRYYLDNNLPLPQFLQNISVRTAYLFAEREYVPQGLYQGEVVLFRATEGEGIDEPYVNVYSDPLFGWGKRVTQGVKVYDIPGGHSSMLQEPNVIVMAEKMQALIDAAVSDQSVPDPVPAVVGG
jgi:FkbH-like protein